MRDLKGKKYYTAAAKVNARTLGELDRLAKRHNTTRSKILSVIIEDAISDQNPGKDSFYSLLLDDSQTMRFNEVLSLLDRLLDLDRIKDENSDLM